MKNTLKAAILTKLKSDNGFFVIEPGIQLGTLYWIYPESVQTAVFLHQPTGKRHRAQIVFLEDGSHLPMELLTITDEIKGEPQTTH